MRRPIAYATNEILNIHKILNIMAYTLEVVGSFRRSIEQWHIFVHFIVHL